MDGYVLLLDTSTKLGMCAVIKGNDLLALKYVSSDSSHSERMFLAIDSVLSDSSIEMKNISKIIYTAGPGSFTGLRITYSAVKGFITAYPYIVEHGVSTLKALMENLSGVSYTKVVLISDAGADVYVYAVDANGKILIPEQSTSFEDVMTKLANNNERMVFIGSGAIKYKDQLTLNQNYIVPVSESMNMINPFSMSRLIKETSLQDLNYLKASYAEKNKRKEV